MLLLDNFEQLLLKQWATFIELRPFTDYILSLAQGADLRTVDEEYSANGIQLKLSRFLLTPEGFLIWVEFIVPKSPSETLVGTVELLLTNDGTFQHLKTGGAEFKRTSFPARQP